MDQLPADHATVVFGGGCGNKRSYAPQYYDNQVTQEAAQQLTITAGHVTSGINAAMLPGATITGRITTADGGRPVPDACVQAIPVNAASASLGIGNGVLTGRLGRYTITGLRTGSYRIVVNPNCLETTLNLRTVTVPHPVRVTQGKVTAAVNAALLAGGSITGQVTGPAAAAVRGACEVAYQIPGGPVASALTGAHGAYTLTGLAPGSTNWSSQTRPAPTARPAWAPSGITGPPTAAPPRSSPSRPARRPAPSTGRCPPTGRSPDR